MSVSPSVNGPGPGPTSATPAQRQYSGQNAGDLLMKQLPPVRWAVPELLPEGFTILGGKPKMGKSWMALGLAVAVATGGRALGSTQVKSGEVLYLALEDNERRMRERLLKVLGAEASQTVQRGQVPAGLERFEVYYSFPRVDQTPGLVTMLGGWLEDHPSARLVVIDTLARIRPARRGNGNAYDQDYADIAPLQELAGQYNVAILAIHHLRKATADDPFDTLSGTLGLSGAADAVLVLTRDRARADAVLTGAGRDIPDLSLALRWDPDIAAWSAMGDADEYRLSSERQEVIELIRRIGKPVYPKDLYPLLPERRPDAIRMMLSRMARSGDLIVGASGKYVFSKVGGND